VNEERLQFWSLYLARFANGFGFITLVTLMPFYVELFEASDLLVGLYYTGFTLAQTVAVIPLALAGDRYDKRQLLLGIVGLNVLAYLGFTLVAGSVSFIGIRALQGVAVTGSGLMTLSLVGELADHGTRANYIGKANAARFLASIVGSLSAAALYQTLGFTPIYTIIVVVFAVAFAGIWFFLPDDDTRISGNPFTDLALNRRIITLTSFRAQYAFAVTIVRAWVPLYAGLSVARGGLGYTEAAIAVSVIVVSEKVTNMLCQPFTGRLSDTFGRSLFIFGGGGAYGLVALAVPFTPVVGESLGLPASFPILGTLSAAFLPLVFLNGLLGVADAFREPASMALFADEGTDEGGVAASFGIRELVWRPGSVLAPLLGAWLMGTFGMEWAFYVGGAFAITGVCTFVGVLTKFHGPGALTEW
jgi:MFS family permease